MKILLFLLKLFNFFEEKYRLDVVFDVRFKLSII